MQIDLHVFDFCFIAKNVDSFFLCMSFHRYEIEMKIKCFIHSYIFLHINICVYTKPSDLKFYIYM